uniref:RING-type domain-containing protein n=1 Tax=Trichogramma kaykai TaxID=54128 RepID=A0ABD2WGG9_9HYME
MWSYMKKYQPDEYMKWLAGEDDGIHSEDQERISAWPNSVKMVLDSKNRSLQLLSKRAPDDPAVIPDPVVNFSGTSDNDEYPNDTKNVDKIEFLESTPLTLPPPPCKEKARCKATVKRRYSKRLLELNKRKKLADLSNFNIQDRNCLFGADQYGVNDEKDDNRYEIVLNESLSLKCSVCRNQLIENPIVTSCKHYFCEDCAPIYRCDTDYGCNINDNNVYGIIKGGKNSI